MTIIKHIILGTLLGGLVCSCSYKKNDRVHRTEDYSLIVKADKCFNLDSETVQTTEYLQLFKSGGKIIFSFVNEYDNSIVLYDYATGKNMRKIKFEREGANGINSVTSYLIINEDSIYLYDRTTHLLILANDRSIVKDKKRINIVRCLKGDSIFAPSELFPRTNSPILKIGDELLLSGTLFYEFEGENDSNRPVMAFYNLQKNTIRYSDSYPSMYHSGNWGGSFTYRFPYYTLSPNNELVISFAADHNIRVHHVNSLQYHEFYAGTKEDIVIEPVEKSLDFEHFSPEADRDHYVHSLNYGCIHYDSYREVYYRLAGHPDSSIDPKEGVLRKPMSVTILDKNFQIVGETMLPQELYLLNQCFVGPDGFHIQVESEDDDIMRFKTFELLKL
ncbi:DUF4221 family protein [Bacteroides sp.]|uniref:DUF4221 family protein n=1 Tax=Bacteroides TaxID=816 RepID=UPI0003366CB6|nr:DUF4221 family protein [Bacteroides fragilis]CCZ38869.1 uncharacterized protein BN707_02660 [Bacteroides fragilis CAG:558]